MGREAERGLERDSGKTIERQREKTSGKREKNSDRDR